MTRKKVKLVWIVNDAARKASLKKRRIGLLKKVSELTTLCGVSAFVIIYSPDEAEPMLWPSKPVVQQMLMRYQNIPEIDRCKKMMNQETYLKERMGKIMEQSKKSQKKNRDIEMSYLMDRLHYEGNGVDDFQTSEMQMLVWLLEERMRDIRKRVEYFQQVPPLIPPGVDHDHDHEHDRDQDHGHDFPPPPLPPPASQPQEGHNMEEMRNDNNPTDAMMWDQWFLDMVNNNESNTAGNSGIRNDMVGPPQHGYNFSSGFHGDMGALGLGLPMPYPHGNFNSGNASFDMGLPPPPPHMGGNPFGIGLPHGNIAGSSNSGENAMGLELPPPPSNTGGGSGGNDQLGLPGFFGGGSDMGWPHNFSP